MLKYAVLMACSMTIQVHGMSGQSVTSTVFGVIAEESTKTHLPFVIITLRGITDTSFQEQTSTDQGGRFTFSHVPSGEYTLETRMMGYAKAEVPIHIGNGTMKDADLGTIFLSDFSELLKEAEIRSTQPAFVSDIDRKIYYPGNDLQATSGSASDVMERIPSITIDEEGTLLMRGSADILFLLNGKPTGLLKYNAAVALDQIPASAISSIEVITTPSAKYKPDGPAGIINIVTKKNMVFGFHGTVQANASDHKRYNGNISMTHASGKWNVSTAYGFRQNYHARTYDDFRIQADELTGMERDFRLANTSSSTSSSHTASVILGYAPDDRTSMELSGSWLSFISRRISDESVVENDLAGTIRQYSTERNEKDTEWEADISGSIEHEFKKEGQAISLEGGFDNFNELEETTFTDHFIIPEVPGYRGRNRIDKKGHTFYAGIDYAQPLGEESELEAGYEGEFSSGDLDYKAEYYDPGSQEWTDDIARSNQFLYRQNSQSLYATWATQIESFELMAGLRAEQTNITSELITLDSFIPNHYFGCYPSLHLSFETGEEGEIKLGYSRRINRPDPDELNPFPEYTDIRDIEAGNPLLKPEQIHSIELGYHWRNEKLSFHPTLYYRQVADAFAEESMYINDSTILTTLQNLETARSGGLELVATWEPSSRLSFNVNTNTYYHTIDASNLGYDGDKSNIAVDTKLAAYMNATSTTRLQVNATYRSPMLSAQGRSLAVYYVNAGIKQDIFNRKASLTLTLSDIFNTLKWQYIIDTPELYQKVNRKRKSQIIYLGCSYRFGISSKKQNDELLFDDKL